MQASAAQPSTSTAHRLAATSRTTRVPALPWPQRPRHCARALHVCRRDDLLVGNHRLGSDRRPPPTSKRLDVLDAADGDDREARTRALDSTPVTPPPEAAREGRSWSSTNLRVRRAEAGRPDHLRHPRAPSRSGSSDWIRPVAERGLLRGSHHHRHFGGGPRPRRDCPRELPRRRPTARRTRLQVTFPQTLVHVGAASYRSVRAASRVCCGTDSIVFAINTSSTRTTATARANGQAEFAA
jgi:hypothetical protein